MSSEEQTEGYSLAAEVRAILAHCAQHGWDVVARYDEPGESARSEDERKWPAFRPMMADAEAGAFDVIQVHTLDRFAPSRRIAFDAFHRLGTAGVGFVSLSENRDYSTPAGQPMPTMLVGTAQFYADNLAFETKKGKAERKAQGLYNGLLPHDRQAARPLRGPRPRERLRPAVVRRVRNRRPDRRPAGRVRGPRRRPNTPTECLAPRPKPCRRHRGRSAASEPATRPTQRPGDLDRAEYQARRAKVHDDLAAFLADVGSAWRIVTPAERNRIARQLLTAVVIDNRTAVAVVPRPDLRPFFVTVTLNSDRKGALAEATGIGFAGASEHLGPSSSPPSPNDGWLGRRDETRISSPALAG